MIEKQCADCKATKPTATGFYASKRNKTGFASYCKDCHRIRNAQWARAHKAEMKAYQCRYKTERREHWLGVHASIGKRHRDKLREEVLAAYGGCCKCCGETEPQFLTVDHVFNDGAQERQRRGNKFRPGSGMYARLRREGFPQDRYQLLCWNCNLSKRFNGECIHAIHARALIRREMLKAA